MMEVVRIRTKGNRYQKKIREYLQRNLVDKLNLRKDGYFYIEETYGTDTQFRPTDMIIRCKTETGYEYDYLYVECKHIQRATRGTKKKWWDHVRKRNAIIVYRENRREDKVIYNSHLCETYLDEYIKMKLEGRYGV